MAIDLQKLEQKFNALLDDPNFVTDFEQWLEARNVSQNHAKRVLCAVKLILLYDYNVVAKEIITFKPLAYLIGFFWKYNILFHLKRDYLVVDA